MLIRKIGIYMTIIVIVLFLYVDNARSYNFEYINVTTHVNVTHAYPFIDEIIIDQDILLFAGTTKTINCNVTVVDWNGYNDIVGVNATLWDDDATTMGAADNYNNHYTNESCNRTSANGYSANYTCSFSVWYYANPSNNWLCNSTVIDTLNYTGWGYNTTNVTEYFALNVTPVIDFGDMTLSEISNNFTANITNIGNSRINISVKGYGGFDPVAGDGLAMICNAGNITIDNEKFSSNSADNFAAKTSLASSLQNITGVSIPKRVTISTWNSTYWQLYTNPTNTPFGVCNGTIEFNAFSG